MSGREFLCLMLLNADIKFKIDDREGWRQRVVIEGDRCFVFDEEGKLVGIRSHDDSQSFDDGP